MKIKSLESKYLILINTVHIRRYTIFLKDIRIETNISITIVGSI